MGLIGSLGTVDKVASRRPIIVITAALAEGAAGAQACAAIANRAPLAVHSFTPGAQVPDGLVRIGLWLIWTVAVSLWLFTTPGRVRFSRTERSRLDDELVLHHRAAAYRAGFATLALLVLTAAVAAAAGQIVGWWSVAALTISLVVAACTFSALELRDA